MRVGLCPDQPLCPAQLPRSLSAAGPAGPCPLPGGLGGAVVNVGPCWSSVWEPCSARSRGSPAQPICSHPAHTVLTRVLWPQLDHSGLSTMSWPSSSSATMPRVPPAPVPSCGPRLDSHSSPCSCRSTGLSWELPSSTITLTQGLHRSIRGEPGGLPRAIGFAAVPLTCPPEIFLLLFQERLLGRDPLAGAAPTHC